MSAKSVHVLPENLAPDAQFTGEDQKLDLQAIKPQSAILKAPLVNVHDAYQEGFQEGKKQSEKSAYALGFEAGKAAALKALEEEVLAKARETTHEHAKQQGFKEGKEEGLSAGIQEAKAILKRELDSGMQQLSAICASLQKTHANLKSDFHNQLQDDCLLLAMTLVGRLLGDSQVYVEYLRHNIHEAMKHAKTMQALTLLVHPADLPIVHAALNHSKAMLDVKSHHEISVGGCILQWPDGALEFQLDEQIKALYCTLKDIRADFQADQS